MLFKFKNLMLEVTRRCNMQCAHCMRGEAEDFDLDYDVIYHLCNKATRIEQLSLTGGEPSLGAEIIAQLATWLSYYGCEVGSFFCATNAKQYSKEFVDALNALYSHCDKKQNCILTISTDQFHSEPDPKALEEYRKLPYYNPVNEKGQIPPHKILNEGRAEDNGIGAFSAPYIAELYDTEFDGVTLNVNDRLYINVFGEVLLEPDARYSVHDEITIGNMVEQSMTDIVLSNVFKIPDHWVDEKQQSVYCVKLKADAGIISPEPAVNELYYPYPKGASAAFHNIYHNIQMTPINPDLGDPPTGLKLSTEWMPVEDMRCIGSKILYHFPGEDVPRVVTLEVIRCPMEEEFNHVRF